MDVEADMNAEEFRNKLMEALSRDREKNMRKLVELYVMLYMRFPKLRSYLQSAWAELNLPDVEFDMWV